VWLRTLQRKWASGRHVRASDRQKAIWYVAEDVDPGLVASSILAKFGVVRDAGARGVINNVNQLGDGQVSEGGASALLGKIHDLAPRRIKAALSFLGPLGTAEVVKKKIVEEWWGTRDDNSKCKYCKYGTGTNVGGKLHVGDHCPYRLLYIKDAVAWTNFTVAYKAATDGTEAALYQLGRFWATAANFIEPNIYFLYGLAGKGNPWGKECLACLW
tara:strand:- start:2547 stop:3191 length:645 start_codon:yes stop_codon:yes gene_type:complete